MRNNSLRSVYKLYRSKILRALRSFRENRKDPSRVWEELVFCLCTPQTRARNALNAVEKMRSLGLLNNPDSVRTALVLKECGVRFHKTKADNILRAFRQFGDILDRLKSERDVFKLRDYLVNNVKGLGMKEASHFLRNIGFEECSIIDRHVLSHLVSAGFVRSKPRSLTRKRYLILERKFKLYAEKAGFKPSVLDLVVWAAATGEVIK
ncbi:MAG: N-glycosylase/DNA lyase [Candidatus Caldarchaeum sp.]